MDLKRNVGKKKENKCWLLISRQNLEVAVSRILEKKQTVQMKGIDRKGITIE